MRRKSIDSRRRPPGHDIIVKQYSRFIEVETGPCASTKFRIVPPRAMVFAVRTGEQA